MTRQFQSIELSKADALALRDLIRPLPDLHYVSQTITAEGIQRFCIKLYRALLELDSMEEDEGVNIEVTIEECLLINHFIANEEWGGAKELLKQTWKAMDEYETGVPYDLGNSFNSLMAFVNDERTKI